MKRFFRDALLLAALMFFPLSAFSQSDGVVVYSLPSTSLHLSVEALRESYTPGPYCKYAKKYLGVDAKSESSNTYSLLSVKLTPYLEADRNKTFVANLSGLKGSDKFFAFTSQGLIFLSDANKGQEQQWRFPTLMDNFNALSAGATDNLTSTETTLYKNVKNAQGGYDRVAVQQSQVVEKSLEKKAQEAATVIFNLRKKRVDIITGDTDATFSGEAMKAVIEEMSKLEEGYMSLFLGTSESAVQKMEFDVVPDAAAERQMYVAFRMSDSQGLTMASDISGRPIVLELIPEEADASIATDSEETSSKSKSSKFKRGSSSKGDGISYRIPKICQVKILDGQNLLLQSRFPIYQLGQTLQFPLEMLNK